MSGAGRSLVPGVPGCPGRTRLQPAPHGCPLSHSTQKATSRRWPRRRRKRRTERGRPRRRRRRRTRTSRPPGRASGRASRQVGVSGQRARVLSAARAHRPLCPRRQDRRRVPGKDAQEKQGGAVQPHGPAEGPRQGGPEQRQAVGRAPQGAHGRAGERPPRPAAPAARPEAEGA